MQIVETPVFTRRVTELLSHDGYRLLQAALLARPDMGAVIVGTGGARKVRWSVDGRGKSGGVRAIYYHATLDGVIYMLLIFAKNEQENLSDAQKNALRKIISNLG
ncbi:MAG TPA: type II toxin-antitoxin system RelE/ParE family toxin [Longimicrobium sp.]|jgi:hypothetical protein